MKVFLAGIDRSPSATEAFALLAGQDRHRVHELVLDPVEADVVLFTDLHLLPHDIGLRTIRKHPLHVAHREKCFVYDERDNPWENLPGLYVSMPNRAFDPSRMVAAPYYMLNRPSVPQREPALLFSFLGSQTHPLRRQILEVRHPRALVEDTAGFTFFTASSDDQRRTRYAEVLADSKFVLCPRGTGTSSIRLFETLAAGRVPVVISDDWVPPPGPDWPSMTVRVAERDIAKLPTLLEAREADWERLAARTSEAFNEHFAQESAWHNLVGGLEHLRAAGVTGGFPAYTLTRQRLHAERVHATWCGKAKIRVLIGRR